MAVLIKSQGPNHFYGEDDGDQEQQQNRVDIKILNAFIAEFYNNENILS